MTFEINMTEIAMEKEDLEKTHSTHPSDIESNGEKSFDVDNEFVPKRTTKFIILLACVAALGGLIFGYDIAGAGATFLMQGFQLHFGWTCAEGDVDCTPASVGIQDRDKGLINGLFGVGAAFGALINPYFAENKGRKVSLSISSVVFILGASIQTAAPTMQVMWAGRVFSGMGIGMLSMCAPVYVAECAPEHTRGALGTLWQLAITTGIVVASAANLGLKNWDEGWRISYGGNILFAILMIFCLLFMPESPRWLAAHGTEEQVKASLSKVRFEDEVEAELKKLQHEVEEELKMGVAPWSEVFSNHLCMRRRVILGVVLMGFQQLSGINAVMFYAPNILQSFFSDDASIFGAFILNVINFLATFITVVTVDRFGRTKLLVIGGSFMFPCLLTIGILATIPQTLGIGYAVVVFSGLYIIGFAFSWGPVLWILVGEMFPYRTRGKAAGAMVMSNWIFTTIVGAVFPAAQTASLAACFFFFAGAIFIGSAIVYFFQVETAGKTSDQIDEAYKQHLPALKRKDW